MRAHWIDRSLLLHGTFNGIILLGLRLGYQGFGGDGVSGGASSARKSVLGSHRRSVIGDDDGETMAAHHCFQALHLVSYVYIYPHNLPANVVSYI